MESFVAAIARARNEKNRLSQIRLDGVSACTVLRPEYKTHKQKDANSFVFVIKNKEDKLRGRSLDNCIY